MARQEQAMQAAARQEADRKEFLRQQELADQEQARIEITRQAALRQEALRQEGLRQETAKAEAARAAETARKADEARLEAARVLNAQNAALAQEALRAQRAREAAGRSADSAVIAGASAAQGSRSSPVNGSPITNAAKEPTAGSTTSATTAPAPPADALRNTTPSRTRSDGDLPGRNTVPADRRLTLLGRPNRDIRLTMFSEAWRQAVERRAPFEMLAAAKTGPYVNPLVTVALRQDGSVESVVVRRSSGIAELDEAIRKVILMLSPFTPLPLEIADDYDVVEIDRVWTFGSGLRLIYGGR